MEVINLLRIELAEEVASLPESLRSAYPDIAVDFLHSVFKDEAHNPMPRLPAAALQLAQEHAQSAQGAASPLPPFPSEESLEAAAEFVEAVEAAAVALEKSAVPRASDFAAVLRTVHEPVDGEEGLVQCQRCRKVMFSSVVTRHSGSCTTAANNATQASELRASDLPMPPSSIDTRDGSRGKKRRQSDAAAAPGPPQVRSRLSKGGTTSSGHKTPTADAFPVFRSQPDYDNPPLSPVLAAAAASRQGRSAGSRNRRKVLEFVPGQDLEEPLVLNASPRAPAAMGWPRSALGAAAAAAAPIPRKGGGAGGGVKKPAPSQRTGHVPPPRRTGPPPGMRMPVHATAEPRVPLSIPSQHAQHTQMQHVIQQWQMAEQARLTQQQHGSPALPLPQQQQPMGVATAAGRPHMLSPHHQQQQQQQQWAQQHQMPQWSQYPQQQAQQAQQARSPQMHPPPQLTPQQRQLQDQINQMTAAQRQQLLERYRTNLISRGAVMGQASPSSQQQQQYAMPPPQQQQFQQGASASWPTMRSPGPAGPPPAVPHPGMPSPQQQQPMMMFRDANGMTMHIPVRGSPEVPAAGHPAPLPMHPHPQLVQQQQQHWQYAQLVHQAAQHPSPGMMPSPAAAHGGVMMPQQQAGQPLPLLHQTQQRIPVGGQYHHHVTAQHQQYHHPQMQPSPGTTFVSVQVPHPMQ